MRLKLHKRKFKSIRSYRYKLRKLDKKYRLNRRRIRRSKKAQMFNVKKNSNQWNDKAFYSFLKNTDFKSNKELKYKKIKNEAIVRIPKIFSFMHNPEQTIGVYNTLYNISKDKKINSVYFDHSNCEELGLGASTVMDVFAMNFDNKLSSEGKDVQLHGRLPEDPKINAFLQVSGILKHLNINEDIDEIVENMEGIEKFDLVKGGKHCPSLKIDSQATSASASTLISDYFDRCLNTHGYELSDDGHDLLCKMVGEVIDNCTIHSGDFCQWFTLGNYFKVDEYGECNLVLFNFGQSIYEGLKKQMDSIQSFKDKTSLQLKESLNRLTNIHYKNGFFGPKWDEEVLWTLYSLQDGVSRCLSDEEPDRGTGTVRLIEAFQEIGDTHDGKTSEMCIISGRTQIKFTNDYQLSDNGDERQIIAFNEGNDLNKPPDDRFVRSLKNYFPGTVISMKFYLDRKFIDETLEKTSEVN